MTQAAARLSLVYQDAVLNTVETFSIDVQAADYMHRLMSRVSPYGIECCTAMTATQVLMDRNLRRRTIRNALADMAEEIINIIENGDSSELDMPSATDVAMILQALPAHRV